jgi:outer membrane receptor for ferrienterochelin and colicin
MHSMKRLAYGAGLLALCTAMSTAVYAQETSGGLHGTVTNAGAPAANTAVTILHVPSGTRQTTATNSEGVFDARGLRVGGPYTITVGSRAYSGVYVDLGKTVDFDADLAAAPEEVQAITITAGRRDNTQGPKTVLTADDIASVVTINRDIRDVARRDILVSQDMSGARSGANQGGISIAGSNPRFNRIAVDGVSAQDNYGLAQGGLTTNRGPVNIDAVQQVTVAAVPTDVENGDFTGGAINLVLKSGGNQFHGSAFINYLNEGMIGKHIGTVRVAPVVTQKSFGGFLSGPIVEDKLFFALSYEKYETTDPTLFGVTGQGLANNFNPALSQATFDSVRTTFDGYASDYDFGVIAGTQPILDKKYSAKLDWNINDRHRASLTYRYALSSSVSRADLGVATATTDSHWYTQSNRDTATTLEINSRWTDDLSTTLKATYRDYRNGQNPRLGQNFSEVAVCTAPASDGVYGSTTNCQAGFSSIRFGPDQFRHANSLDMQEARFSAQAEYTFGSHLFKLGAQARHADVFNIFVSQSDGVYTFDSLADFQAGRAGALIYQNAVTGNPTDAALNYDSWTNSIYFQDTLQITDTIKATAGVRYDWYILDKKPTLNPNFLARNGFDNTTNIDGLHTVQPRFALEWKATPDLTFNTGVGLFAGGTPDVLTGTPYNNTGYLTSNISILRVAGVNGAPDTFIEQTNAAGFTQAIGAAALNNLNTNPTFGYALPAAVRTLQQGPGGGVGIPTTSEVIALSPSFRLPSQWKAFFGARYRIWDWNITADVIATQANDEITYYDNRVQRLVINGVAQTLPDGRIRYDGLTTTAANRALLGITSANAGSNRDLIATNVDKGRGFSYGIQASRSWDWGGNIALGYGHSDATDMGPGLRFGTTAGSLYASVPAYMDPNRSYAGRSVDEIDKRYKLELGFRKEFFGDNESRFTLFGERQSGRPFGFAMSDAASGRSPVFGVNQTAQALYVPDFAGDSNTADLNVGLVTFNTQADYDNFKRYVTQFKLPSGQLLQKYSNTNKDINRVDFQYSQELPSIWDGHKFKLVFDVRNVLNLIDRDWGKAQEFSDVNTMTRVSCADATGVAIAATSAACPRYRYSNVLTSIVPTRNNAQSLWYLQVGLRYEF